MKVIQDIIHLLAYRGLIDKASFLLLEKEGYCSLEAYTRKYGSLDPSENTESGYDYDYDYDDGEYEDTVDGDPFIEMGAALDLIADLIRKQERPFTGAKERKKRMHIKAAKVNKSGVYNKHLNKTKNFQPRTATGRRKGPPQKSR